MLEVFNIWSGETVAMFQRSSQCWEWIMAMPNSEDFDVREEDFEEEWDSDEIEGSE